MKVGEKTTIVTAEFLAVTSLTFYATNCVPLRAELRYPADFPSDYRAAISAAIQEYYERYRAGLAALETA